jgi:CubicO group peptidase (beta-lactamase class C family)
MTATLLATLVEQGKLRWDSTIAEVFPEESRNWNAAWHSVTLEQLLAHRSGLPAEFPRDLWARCWKREGTPTQQRMMLADGLLRDPPKHKAGEKFEYSNANFTIAGAMAERVTGAAWEDLMRERLYAPLGITTAGVGAPGTPGSIDQPRGHRRKGDAWTPVEPGPAADNPPAIAPAGTVHMSLPDWGKFIGAHAKGERAGSKLLKPETYARLHTPVNGWEYAYGWGMTRRPWAAPAPGEKDGRAITHSGSNTMWFCVVWAAPERGMAVMVATNCAGEGVPKACDDACVALIGDADSRAGAGGAPSR